MKRRAFVASLAGVAAWPRSALAQQAPLVGVLMISNPEPFSTVFRDALRKLGYVEGKNIRLEFRIAEGAVDRLPASAAELVRLKPRMMVGQQTPAVHALKRATTEIPIVMAVAGDPVGTGLVASLARPGGNITGLSGTTAEAASKILELIRELKPGVKRVAALPNSADPFSRPFLEQIQTAGRSLGIETPSIGVNATSELDNAFAEVAALRPDAVIVQPSLPRRHVATLAIKHRLPALSPSSAFTDDGGLMSFAADLNELYRESAV